MVQLEGPYKDHQVQLPDHVKANQKLKPVIEAIVKVPLQHWQASTTSLGSLTQCFTTLAV